MENGDTEKDHVSSLIQDFIFSSRKKGYIKCISLQVYNKNQVPHLSQDTKWESNTITINITNKSKEVSHFPSDDHKAAMNRRESMTNTRH